MSAGRLRTHHGPYGSARSSRGDQPLTTQRPVGSAKLAVGTGPLRDTSHRLIHPREFGWPCAMYPNYLAGPHMVHSERGIDPWHCSPRRQREPADLGCSSVSGLLLDRRDDRI